MKWTTKKPTRPGWYRYRDQSLDCIVEVYEYSVHGDDMRSLVEDEDVLVRIYNHTAYSTRLCDLDGVWAGPIPEPLMAV